MERSKESLCLEITQLSLIFAATDSGDGTPPQPEARLIYTLGEKDPRPGVTAWGTCLRQQGRQHPRELSMRWAEHFCCVGGGREPRKKHLSGNGSVVHSGCSGAGCCLRTCRFCYWVRTGPSQRCSHSKYDHFMVLCMLKSNLKSRFVNMRNTILF